MPFVLHEDDPGEMVEALGIMQDEAGVEGFEEGEIFAKADRHARLAQIREEAGKHHSIPRRPASTVSATAARVRAIPCTAAYCQ